MAAAREYRARDVGTSPSPKHRIGLLRGIFVALALVLIRPGWVSAQDLGTEVAACVACHPRIDIARRRDSVHGRALTCLSCHHVGLTDDPVASARNRLTECAACHRDTHPTHAGVGEGAPICTDCHRIHAEPGADANAEPAAACGKCHDEVVVNHQGDPDRPTPCVACHVQHVPPPLAEKALERGSVCRSCHTSVSQAHPDVGIEGPTCGTCHAVHAAGGGRARLVARSDRVCRTCHEETPSRHGDVAGAASGCSACHAAHGDPGSAADPVTVSRACSVCHEREGAAYAAGGHADGLNSDRPNPDLPTCVTCHPEHERVAASGIAEVRGAATHRCMACHATPRLIRKYVLPADVTSSYGSDFHGATLHFQSVGSLEDGQMRVMVCSDCHGPHRVAVPTQGQVRSTCLSCHEQADARLAGAWLGHDPVGPRHELPVFLVRLFYYVLIPFSLLGLGLNIVFHLIAERRKGARLLETHGMKRIRERLRGRRAPHESTVARFTLLERMEHLGAMVTFFLLALTGLPQARPHSELANAIISALGGIATTRLIHRVTGFVFVALLALHVGRGVGHALRRRRLPDITPRRSDFRNAVQAIRHYLRGTPKPKVGRFDSGEKFEYWGLFLGGTLMSVTGLALVFPEMVSHVLPGVVVTVMRTLHGLEATFAVLVVVLWHSYGVILRPEIFPLDTTMFTGRISLERLKEEHALQYEEMFAGQEGSEIPPRPAPPRASLGSTPGRRRPPPYPRTSS